MGAGVAFELPALPIYRGHQSLAYQEAAKEDPQRPAQGGLHWCLAPCPSRLLHRPGWAEGLPPPYRAEQEGVSITLRALQWDGTAQTLIGFMTYY